MEFDHRAPVDEEPDAAIGLHRLAVISPFLQHGCQRVGAADVPERGRMPERRNWRGGRGAAGSIVSTPEAGSHSDELAASESFSREYLFLVVQQRQQL